MAGSRGLDDSSGFGIFRELKPGLIIFRRGDVEHRMWYCRMKMPKADRYKTVSLKTSDKEASRERDFDQDAAIRSSRNRLRPIIRSHRSSALRGRQ